MAQFQFNAQGVAPAEGANGALPKGWYETVITDSEMKPTKDGNGQYLQLEHTIVAPASFANRKVWARLNLQNQNQTAVEIAYGELSAICHAIGVMSFNDTTELHNRPMKIRLKVRKGNDDYDDSNEISSWKPQNHDCKLVESGGGGSAPQGQQPWQQPGAQQAPPQAPPQQQPAQQPQHPPQGTGGGGGAAQPWQQPNQQPAQQPWQQPQGDQGGQPWQQPPQQPPQQPNQQPPAQQGGDQPPWAQGAPQQAPQGNQQPQQQQPQNLPQPSAQATEAAPPWQQPQGQQPAQDQSGQGTAPPWAQQ